MNSLQEQHQKFGGRVQAIDTPDCVGGKADRGTDAGVGFRTTNRPGHSEQHLYDGRDPVTENAAFGSVSGAHAADQRHNHRGPQREAHTHMGSDPSGFAALLEQIPGTDMIGMESVHHDDSLLSEDAESSADGASDDATNINFNGVSEFDYDTLYLLAAEWDDAEGHSTETMSRSS